MNSILLIDQQIIRTLNSIANKPLDYLMLAVSAVGELAAIWFLIAVFLMIYNKNSSRKTGFLMVVAILITVVIDDVLIKKFVFRERPYLVMEGIHQIGHKWTNSSFPSGHVTSAVAAGIVLVKHYEKFFWPVLVFVILTIVSRPYLGMHFPSDVIAGVFIGVLGALLAFLVGRLFKSQSISR